jgi:hypothetical protein
MIKCPFCHYDNEDGALFCEQCKSDLSAAAPSPPPVPIAIAEPIGDEVYPTAAPIAEAVALHAVPIAEPHPADGIPLVAEALPAGEPLSHPMPPPMPSPAPAPPPPPPPPPVAEAPAAPPVPTPTAPPAPPAVAPAPAAAPPAAPAATAAPAPAAPAPAPAGPAPTTLPAGAQPRLLVLRGQKRNVEYPIYDGLNFIGRADEKPVDIDLEDQEPPDRIWCSRQHACISFENDQLAIEDLNSANGTYVNRNRIYPGQKRPLAPNDIIQIGNVQLKVVV